MLTHKDRFIFNYASIQKEDVQHIYKSFEKFKRKYSFSKKDKNAFYAWLDDKEFEFKQEELEENWETIENRIKSQHSQWIMG